MTDHDKASIPCTDGFRRNRSVRAWAAPASKQLVLLAPPAAAALLSPTQAWELGEQLIELASVAEREHLDLARRGKCGLTNPAYPVTSGSSRPLEVA